MQASSLPLSQWHPSLRPSEFPDGVLKHMCANLLLLCLFPLRSRSGVPLSPSKLYGAHVRHDNGGSLHCTHNKTRLSTATDFHVKDHQHLLKVLTYRHGEAWNGPEPFTKNPMFSRHIQPKETLLPSLRN